MRLTVHEIGRVVEAKNNFQVYEDLELNKLEFDSRKIEVNDVFLALKGQLDGHDFINKAFDKGALISISEKEVDFPHLLVNDSVLALQKLASYYLDKQDVEVIAITGSNGKTTTKDMTAAVLSSHYNCYKTQGNYNNELGLPYTILSMPEETEKLVLEMGMDRPGEIAFLSELARPNLAIITLIGESHLEFFGTRREIARGKMGITKGLSRDSLLIAPEDSIIDEFVPENQSVIRFGENAELKLVDFQEEKNYIKFKTNFLDTEFTIPLQGKFNAMNALIAVYVGDLKNVPLEKIKKSLKEIELTKNRTQWRKTKNGAELLSDVYNANPTAMRLIIESFQELPSVSGSRKILLLADMLELGAEEIKMHEDIAEVIQLDKIDKIYLYGPLMKYLAKKIPTALHFTDFNSLKSEFIKELKKNDQLLLKGSNSMRLSELVDLLCENNLTES
ncbi:MAG: UDP-N-acetylmuramoyl-tripeptide--D-alanyl-D-alanine ligase [Lactovum sp.]